jgi:predicted MFS family arabinose efflux permease
VFIGPFAGCSLAALTNTAMHNRLGQRRIAIVGPCCHLIPYNILSIHPPYPVLVITYLIVGLGNGLIDAAWCSWIGDMVYVNQVSGFLVACYSLGATIAPLISSLMFSEAGLPWYTFYYIMIRSSTPLAISTYSNRWEVLQLSC